MNKIESFVYGHLKNNPLLKNYIRNIYQSVFDIFPRKKDFLPDNLIIKPNSFFGFHDQSPFSNDNKFILSNYLRIPLRMPTDKDFLEFGFYSGSRFENWNFLGTTYAWNYHKGSRLQWIANNRVIYNDWEKDHYVSKICTIDGGTAETLEYPIDSVASNGELASSFCYNRLELMMPGYGYVHREKESDIESKCPESTGIYLISLKKNTRKIICSLKLLNDYLHLDSMNGAFHFVTHSSFSMDNRFLAFLHRWYNGMQRNTRLIVIDLLSNELYVSPTDGMVSHYAWNNKGQIIAFCSINGIYSHVLFEDPYLKNYRRVAYPMLNSDGHQHFLNNDLFVTDTYPNRMRQAKLFLVDTQNQETTLLASVNSPKKYQSPSENKHWCCDLHPRASKDGSYISFDSVHTGCRSQCIFKI